MFLESKKAFLEVPKLAGSLGLHNFTHYYWAANINKFTFWTSNWEWVQTLFWANIKLDNPQFPPLCSTTILVNLFPQIHNPVVKRSLKIWFQLRKPLTNYDPSLLCWAITYFCPPKLRHHSEFGIMVCFFSIKGTFRSLETLQLKQNIPQNCFTDSYKSFCYQNTAAFSMHQT